MSRRTGVRAIRALLVMAYSLAFGAPAAHGGNIVTRYARPGAWPGSVPFMVCEESISGLSPLSLKAKLLQRTCDIKPDRLLSATNAAQVRATVEAWNAGPGSTVKFIEIDAPGPRPPLDTTHVVVFTKKAKVGCGTQGIGYSAEQTRKEIGLHPECNGRILTAPSDAYLSPYTIMHEMMHAIGIYHEQARPDREEAIKVDLGAVATAKQDKVRQAEMRHQYDLRGNVNGDYDFSSVMHYPLLLPPPAKPWHVTTTPTIGGLLRLNAQGIGTAYVGQRVRLSPGDLAAIKTLYP